MRCSVGLLGGVAKAWKSWWNTRTMEEVVVVVVEVEKEADSAVEVVEVGGGDAALEDVVLLLYNTVGRLGVSMIEVRDASG